MTGEHDEVRELLAARAVGALPPGEESTVAPHLAECESCAAEAERLRETARLLDGAFDRSDGSDRGPGGGAGGVPGGVLALALRARPAAPRVAVHAAPYAAAVAGLRALVGELDGRWETPVVHDWDVHATFAHLIAADEQLAERLGIAPRVPPSHIPQSMSWADAWNARTADVIAHERARTPADTVATWSVQAGALLATPEALDPELASGATELMGVRLPVADHFLVRAFEVWIHTDDIGRAVGITVPPPPEEHLWRLVHLAVRILGTALSATDLPVLFEVTGGGDRDTRWILGSEGEPVSAELALDPVDFCLLVGGRYAPDEVPRRTTGDEGAVRNVLERAASLAWL